MSILKALPRAEDVFLITGHKDDQPMWYYIWVEKVKQPLLNKRIGTDIEPEELGQVLFWGIGTEPPLYYREKVKKGDFSD